MPTDKKVTPISDEAIVLSGADQGYTQAICPATTVLLSEGSSEFNSLIAAFRRDYRPATVTEDALVQMLARYFWSALRSARIETGLVEIQMDAAGDRYRMQKFIKENNMEDPGVIFEFDTRRLGIAFELDCEEGNAQLKIARLSTAHNSSFLNVQDRLHKLQAVRAAMAGTKPRAA